MQIWIMLNPYGWEWCIISPGMAATLVGDACVEAESNNTKPECYVLDCGKDRRNASCFKIESSFGVKSHWKWPRFGTRTNAILRLCRSEKE